MKDERWIQEATSKNRGAFKRQAARRGMTTAEFIRVVLRPGSRFNARTKRRASLARTLMKLRKK